MKSLVLAEKPSVGRELARVLKCNKKGNGFLEGDKYIVTWALGHLVTLDAPEGYNPEWKKWSRQVGVPPREKAHQACRWGPSGAGCSVSEAEKAI